MLRSRATYGGDEILDFNVTGSTDLVISTTGATSDPLGDFTLSGVTAIGDVFEYTVSFDSTKKNFITGVLGTEAKNGKAPIFVEEISEIKDLRIFVELLKASR